MASPTSRTPQTSANSSTQPQSRPRDWNKLRGGETGSTFRGSGRGRGTRGGGRGGGRPPNSPVIRGSSKLSHTEHSENHGSLPDASTPKAEPSPARKGPSQSEAASTTSEKPAASPADRAPKLKTPIRRASRGVPVVTVAPASPTPDSVQNVPSTPSRNNANRRRRTSTNQHVKPPLNGATKPSIPSSTSLRPQKPRAASTTSSSIAPRKDIPPHLAAAHEAEIRHDIDALVERVRAVAMAENRPSTPGSHIDWAGEEDDSLPDLDDWGVTTTHTNTSSDERRDEISPILADALKPLPEPQTEGDDVEDEEEEHHMEPLNDDVDGEITKDSSDSSPLSNTPDTFTTATTDVHNSPAAAVAPETIMHTDKPSLHPLLPPKPVAARASLRASSARSNLISKSALIVGSEEPPATKGGGLSLSIHAPSLAEVEAPERTLSSSSSDHGLAGSIHAPKGLLESHSAPSLLSPGAPSPARTYSPSHGRSKTEGRPAFPHPRTAAINQRAIRSGTSSPLGPLVHTHARNHSTPPDGAGQRAPHSVRPVITGDALSRLARTIGGIPGMPRARGVAVAKD
ncbi:hypothetical protein BDR05DRAFT_956018 [Suillus weaverae]|nr:hypothetical protein BDR05DRAFT_956018 [Suillus weaverae]